jgi:hypothetical protein
VDEADMKTVSVLHTLFLVFNWLSTREGDIFDAKSARYRRLFDEKLSSLSFDISTDSDAGDFEDEVETGDVQLFRA